MNLSHRRSLVVLVLAALAWQAVCALADDRERGPSGTVAYYIDIETSEPGIRIEVNGEIIGLSPTKVKVFGDRDGTFHHFNKPRFEVRALPVRTGQYLQTKSFSTGGFFVPDDHIPGRIFFDMSLPSDTPGIEPKMSGESKAPVHRSGTGFFITEDGHVLTAYHLVKGATNLQAKVDGRMLSATLVRKDPGADLAILKVDTNSASLPIGPSKQTKLGEHIYSMGFPATDLLGEEPKFTEGIISSVAGFQDDWSQFQVSLPAYAGDSGSPIVNSRGMVIALIVAKPALSLPNGVSGVEFVNYAVKSSRALIVLEDLPDLTLTTATSDNPLSSEEIAALLKRSSVIVTAE